MYIEYMYNKRIPTSVRFFRSTIYYLYILCCDRYKCIYLIKFLIGRVRILTRINTTLNSFRPLWL